MQRRALFSALFATGLGAIALPALAQKPNEMPPHGPQHARPQPQHAQPAPQQRPQPQAQQRPAPHDQSRRYYNARGDEFRQGRRLPTELRHRSYVVADYRRHHLPAPTHRQQWVQVGADYVLVIAATGVIVRVVTGH